MKFVQFELLAFFFASVYAISYFDFVKEEGENGTDGVKINYALLKTEPSLSFPEKFTICSSIFLEYLHGDIVRWWIQLV